MFVQRLLAKGPCIPGVGSKKMSWTNTTLDAWHAKFSSFVCVPYCCDGPYKLVLTSPYMALVQVPGNHAVENSVFVVYCCATANSDIIIMMKEVTLQKAISWAGSESFWGGEVWTHWHPVLYVTVTFITTKMTSDCIDLGNCHACLYGLAAVVVFYSQNQLSWCMSWPQLDRYW